jgi:hypothetical protein
VKKTELKLKLEQKDLNSFNRLGYNSNLKNKKDFKKKQKQKKLNFNRLPENKRN